MYIIINCLCETGSSNDMNSTWIILSKAMFFSQRNVCIVFMSNSSKIFINRQRMAQNMLLLFPKNGQKLKRYLPFNKFQWVLCNVFLFHRFNLSQTNIQLRERMQWIGKKIIYLLIDWLIDWYIYIFLNKICRVSTTACLLPRTSS